MYRVCCQIRFSDLGVLSLMLILCVQMLVFRLCVRIWASRFWFPDCVSIDCVQMWVSDCVFGVWCSAVGVQMLCAGVGFQIMLSDLGVHMLVFRCCVQVILVPRGFSFRGRQLPGLFVHAFWMRVGFFKKMYRNLRLAKQN